MATRACLEFIRQIATKTADKAAWVAALAIPTLAAVSNAFTGAVTAVTGLGYSSGGAVTQATDKSTTVVLSKRTGKITLINAALNAGVIVSFTLTNTTMLAADQPVIQHVSGGTMGCYVVWMTPGAGTGTVYVKNISAGNLSEAIVLRFSLLNSADA